MVSFKEQNFWDLCRKAVCTANCYFPVVPNKNLEQRCVLTALKMYLSVCVSHIHTQTFC